MKTQQLENYGASKWRSGRSCGGKPRLLADKAAPLEAVGTWSLSASSAAQVIEATDALSSSRCNFSITA